MSAHTDAARAAELLSSLRGCTVHHKPPDGDALEYHGAPADGYYCDWCGRDVLMEEMASHGGRSLWASARVDAASPNHWCYELLP